MRPPALWLRAALASLLALAVVPPAAAAARAELYTMGQGDDLFSKFGHAAICIADPELPAGGLCYNYGTTDFSRPIGLGWDVVRGRAEFWVSVSDFLTMVYSFERQDRSIYRQVLPLSDEQVAELRAILERDALPENRSYVYGHFLENCSTRPRDMVDRVTGGALRAAELNPVGTYRDYALSGLASFHWTLVPATDLLIGRWVDRSITTYEAMFMPRVLRRGVERELDVEPVTVSERRAPLAPADVAGARLRLWVFVAVLALLAFVSRYGTFLALGVVVVLGTLIWVGFAISVLPELRWNELLLVLVPFDVVLFTSAGFRYRYLGVRLAVLGVVAALKLSGLFLQPLWPFWLLAAAALIAARWRLASA